MPTDAAYWLKHLDLAPHPEGGYFKEVTRGNYVVRNQRGCARFAYSTIYFLLTVDCPSHFHRLSSDEVWVWHAGDAAEVHAIYKHTKDVDLLSRDEGAAEGPGTDPETLPILQAFIPPHVSAAYERDIIRRDAEEEYLNYQCVRVGPHVDAGEQLQYTVPAEAIFGSTVAPGGSHGYALVSCIVSPSFHYSDLKLITQAQLMTMCPQHETIIRRLAYKTLPE